MITEALTAWMLHQRARGDGCVDVTFFTRERGVLRAFVRRGEKRKKQALLQSFTPLWLVLDERPYGFYVRQLEVMSASFLPHGRQVLAGLYINELLYTVLRPQEPEVLLFDGYQQAVHRLAEPLERMALERVLRRFEWVLLYTSGSYVSFSHESDGVSRLVATKQYAFVPGEGFVSVEQGLCGAHLLAMASDVFDAPDVLKTAKRVMRCAIDHLLDGAPVHARALYRGALNGA